MSSENILVMLRAPEPEAVLYILDYSFSQPFIVLPRAIIAIVCFSKISPYHRGKQSLRRN
jgi:hypothetical protein